ncbi:MAG: hypothetical protein IT530_13610 [Burkholderiales bacterium]|nr:hypothetical protein [Burkholderiales bacterium]
MDVVIVGAGAGAAGLAGAGALARGARTAERDRHERLGAAEATPQFARHVCCAGSRRCNSTDARRARTGERRSR